MALRVRSPFDQWIPAAQTESLSPHDLAALQGLAWTFDTGRRRMNLAPPFAELLGRPHADMHLRAWQDATPRWQHGLLRPLWQPRLGDPTRFHVQHTLETIAGPRAAVTHGVVTVDRWRQPIRVAGMTFIIGPEGEAPAGGSHTERVVSQRSLLQLGSWEWRPASEDIYWSPQMFRLLGRDEAQGTPTRDQFMQRIHPDDRQPFLDEVARSLETGEYMARYRFQRWSDDAWRWIEATAEIQFDSQGHPTRHCGVMRDVTDAEASQRKREALNATLLQHLPDVLWRHCIDDPTDAQLLGPTESLLGLSVETWLRRGPEALLERVHPDDVGPLREALSRPAAEMVGASVEYRVRDGDGRWRWILDRAVGITEEDGKHYIFGSMSDIDQRKQTERSLRLLVHELDHRVKNMLTSVLALADVTCTAHHDLPSFFETFRQRVIAMSRVHELLAESGWRNVNLSLLLDAVSGTNEAARGGPSVADPRRLSFQGADPFLPAAVAEPLGMVLGELIANAMHHGAWAGRDGAGRVDVTCWEMERITYVRWRERGGPPLTVTDPDGEGLDLIRGLVEYQLCGSIRFDFQPKGLICRIEIPDAR